MIALFFCGDLKYCPYIKRYIEILENKELEYRVYFWNRSGEEISKSNNYKYCENKSNLNKTNFEKIFDFWNFRNWCIEQIKNDNPDKIIVLSTLMGVLLLDVLKKDKYIFDIRDYSYEFFLPFYLAEKRVIKKSKFTTISSKGFQNFLPNKKYVIAHNFNRNDKDKAIRFKKRKGPIKLVWNGVMRYFDFQKKYIDSLKNDDRFLMIYHGDGPELDEYKKYCFSQGIKNVVFTGEYNNERKRELLSEADVLNNCYGYLKNEGKKIKYAVSNKFYDGIIYHIPQLVEPNGYKTQLVLENNLGINYEADDSFADKLYDFYMSIDEDKFNISCERMYEEVLEEDDLFVKSIVDFVKGSE